MKRKVEISKSFCGVWWPLRAVARSPRKGSNEQVGRYNPSLEDRDAGSVAVQSGGCGGEWKNWA